AGARALRRAGLRARLAAVPPLALRRRRRQGRRAPEPRQRPLDPARQRPAARPPRRSPRPPRRARPQARRAAGLGHAGLAVDAAAEIAALPRRDTASVRAVRRRWSAELKAAPADEVLAIAKRFEVTASQTGKW